MKTHKTASTTVASMLFRYARRHHLKVSTFHRTSPRDRSGYTRWMTTGRLQAMGNINVAPELRGLCMSQICTNAMPSKTCRNTSTSIVRKMLLLDLSLNLLPALPRIRTRSVLHGAGACIGMNPKLANFDGHYSAVPLNEAVSQVGLRTIAKNWN